MRRTVLCLFLALTPFAAGAEGHDAPPPAPAGASAATITLEQAVERAQRATGARAVRAEEVHEADELVYRVRLLAADGRVFTVRVNAHTGQVD